MNWAALAFEIFVRFMGGGANQFPVAVAVAVAVAEEEGVEETVVVTVGWGQRVAKGVCVLLLLGLEDVEADEEADGLAVEEGYAE